MYSLTILFFARCAVAGVRNISPTQSPKKKENEEKEAALLNQAIKMNNRDRVKSSPGKKN